MHPNQVQRPTSSPLSFSHSRLGGARAHLPILTYPLHAHERAHPSLGSLPTDETRVGEEAGTVVPLLAPAGRRCGGFAVVLELSQTGPADKKKKTDPCRFIMPKTLQR